MTQSNTVIPKLKINDKDKFLEENVEKILKKQIQNFEVKLNGLKLEIESLKKDDNFISQERILCQQQVELFEYEYSKAMSEMRTILNNFKENEWEKFKKISNPPSLIVNIVCKFIFMLVGKKITWNQLNSEEFSYKNIFFVMKEFEPESLKENIIFELNPIIKEYQQIREKIDKISSICPQILDWIKFGIEYKLKKEIVNTSKSKLLELTQKNTPNILNQKLDEQKETFNKISTIKHDLKCLSKIEGEQKLILQNNLVIKYKFKEHYDLNIINNNSNGKSKVILKLNSRNELKKRNSLENKCNNKINKKNSENGIPEEGNQRNKLIQNQVEQSKVTLQNEDLNESLCEGNPHVQIPNHFSIKCQKFKEVKNQSNEKEKTIDRSPKIGCNQNNHNTQFNEYNKQKLIIHHNTLENGICLSSRQKNCSQNFLIPYSLASKPPPKLDINSNTKKNHFTEINRSCLKRYGSVDIENNNPNCVSNKLPDEENDNLKEDLKKPKRNKKITIENTKYPNVSIDINKFGSICCKNQISKIFCFK